MAFTAEEGELLLYFQVFGDVFRIRQEGGNVASRTMTIDPTKFESLTLRVHSKRAAVGLHEGKLEIIHNDPSPISGEDRGHLMSPIIIKLKVNVEN